MPRIRAAMWRRAVAAGAGAVAGIGLVVLSGIVVPAMAPRAIVVPMTGAFKTRPATASPPMVDSTPVRLLIPAITVDALVEARGLDAQRNIDTPRDFRDVAWYDLGPRPGQAGNAIINGHVNWWTGDAVFTRLYRLRTGDEVRVVRSDGATVAFRVSRTQVVDARARLASLFAPTNTPTLTLITCSGVWNPLTQSDTHRLLVTATVV